MPPQSACHTRAPRACVTFLSCRASGKGPAFPRSTATGEHWGKGTPILRRAIRVIITEQCSRCVRFFEWAVVIAIVLSVLSIVPRHCARFTCFPHPKWREIHAVPMTPQPIPLPLRRKHSQRSEARRIQGIEAAAPQIPTAENPKGNWPLEPPTEKGRGFWERGSEALPPVPHARISLPEPRTERRSCRRCRPPRTGCMTRATTRSSPLTSPS